MLARQRSTSLHPERQLILPNDRLAIVMVGLPARGKSFMAKKVYRYLRHLHIITKVFNFGSYRRIATKNTTVGKASASFFDPDNKQGAKIRQQCCIDALHDMISWYNTGGQIGILDATNTSLKRRQFIRDFLANKKSELEYNVSILHIESICNDESIIHNNIITVKLKNPDYCTVDAQKAIQDFKERIKMYKKVYVQVSKAEGSYIKVIDVGAEVMGHGINDYISCRIFYFLMHLHLHRLTKIPKKPLLMQLQNRNDTKKDNEMVDRLKKISASIGAKFTRPAYDRPMHALAPYMRRPSYLMWTESEDTYKSPKVEVNTKPNFPFPVQTMHSSTKQSHSQSQTDAYNASNVVNKSFGPIAKVKLDANAMPPTSTNYNVSFESATSPIHSGAAVASPMPSPMASFRNRPRVRKSTLIMEMVNKRNSFIATPKAISSIMEHIELDEKFEYNGDEMKVDKNKIVEDFHCELCGRTVGKNETTLVDSRSADQDKVRICEVCLYESDTDSEDDTTGDHCDALIDIMHSGPASIMPSIMPSETKLVQYPSNSNESQLGNIQRKMQEMENSVNMLVKQLNENTDNKQKDKHFKQELVRLQQKMQELFQ